MKTKIKKNRTVFINLFLLLSLVIIIFSLTGCQDSSSTQLTEERLRTGTKGLVIKFIKDSPPKIVFENDPAVFISLSVENLGVTDVKKGVIAFGREEDYLAFDEIRLNGDKVNEPVVFDIEGKSLNNPFGGKVFLEIEAHSKDITLSKYQDTSIQVNTCYDYQTILQEEVCIDPIQNMNQLGSRACVAKNLNPGTRGGPVNVKAVEVMSTKIGSNIVRNVFRIKVNNDGKGKVITKGIAELMCSHESIRGIEGVDYRKAWDFVQITARLGKEEMSCKNNGVIKLEKGKTGETICEIETLLREAYVTPLYLQLDYGYTYSIYKNFQIENI